MEQKTTMRAIGFRRYGPPEVLEPLEVPKPGEVLIRVAAAGVNPADWNLRSGRLRLFARLKFPFVPGSDVAGLVEAVGPAATRFRPGDAVYAMTPTAAGGGYAEYAAVAEKNVALTPTDLPLADAASVPLAAMTALQALRDKAGLKPGQHVLINGASGGVGSFAVQIAKALGARATAVSSGRNADLVRGFGADEVLDYTRQDATTGDASYDAVFDTVGNRPFRSWRRVLSKGGVFVTVAPSFGNLALQPLTRLAGGKRLVAFFVRPSGTDLETLSGWISSGQVQPVIDRTYPLIDAAEAHRYSETRRARGKLVLVVDEELAAGR
jgi:NADPH:quinone reductase-like Zn-dependent oxidoreductase